MTKIDITFTAIEKGIDSISQFLSRIVNPAADHVGLLLADRVNLIRFKNQVSILQKAEKYIQEKGITTKQVSLKTLVPLLEGASLEEDVDLQEKWSALLVNYVDSEKNFATTVFPYILSQLSTNEIKGLEYIVGSHQVMTAEEIKNEL